MDRKIKESINQLVDSKRLDSRLEPVPRAAPIAKQRGMASIPAPVVQSGGGGGISGPLTEVPGTRKYGAEQVVVPPDGYYAYSVAHVSQLTLKGPDDQELVINLSRPSYDVTV